MTSGVRRLTFSRAVVPLEIRFVLMAWNYTAPPASPPWLTAPGSANESRRLLIHQERSRGILEPAGRHHLGSRRIRVTTLIKALYRFTVLLILGQRPFDVDRSSDLNQGEQSRRRLAMKPNATVGMRHGPNESLMKTVSWFELTPVRHRISAIRLARPATILLLVINRVVTGRSLRTGFANVTLNSHQQTVPFHHIEILGGGRQFHPNLRRIMWSIGGDVVVAAAARSQRAGRASAEQHRRNAKEQEV